MSTCENLFFLLLLLALTLNCTAVFEVKIPDSSVTGIHGQYVLLRCSFSINKDSSLEDIVITWQTVKSEEVVHSFYYGKNQLEKQSLRFFNRTSLYPSEFKHGNASLKLEGVSPKDAGEYICFVSNSYGSNQATLQLSFAAFFTSPELVIELQAHTMTFVYLSKGYPKPEIEWHSSGTENISELIQTSFQQSENSLYQVTSTLTVHVQSNATYSFILRNKAVNQTVTNVFSLLPGKIPEKAASQRVHWTLVMPIVFLLVILVTGIIFYRHEKHYYIQNKVKTTPSSVLSFSKT
ncbi:CD276 antigen-like [Protopterus annectens]|uniref:CD276 antigen-like n=1 Tax=Protopterus annectens TaxID=7888 RepID=UPI001CF964EC|nr:CD276 antigen-like [Protopterus annectens]XP_043915983.1 CD276 antigen-like [Protopterus annectens]